VEVFPVHHRISITRHSEEQIEMRKNVFLVSYLRTILKLRRVRRKAGARPVVVTGWNSWKSKRNLECQTRSKRKIVNVIEGVYILVQYSPKVDSVLFKYGAQC
jgi:hypothetical protein